MSAHPEVVSTAPENLALAEWISGEWAALGVRGHFLARNVDTGDQLGFDADTPVPLASVVKVPLALAVLQRTADGSLDPGRQVTVDPRMSSFGPTGIAAFRFPVTIAVADMAYLMLTVSDNGSADTLLDLIGIDGLAGDLRDWGCDGIAVRHRLQRMYDSAAGVSRNDFGLALELAIRDDEAGGRHAIDTLDPALGNVGSASALVDLLQRVWLDQVSDPAATAELRRMMSRQVFAHRLSSDLRTDTVTVSAKTGTFLHLRHEIGVVESEAGDRVAIAALTRANRRATLAPDIDLAIGAAARSAFEALRR